MALADILQKIREDAEHKASEIRVNAEKNLDDLRAQLMTESKKMEKDLNERTKLKQRDIDRKIRTTIRMEERNRILGIKQALIQQAFDKALLAVSQSSDQDYKRFLEQLMQSSSVQDFTSGNITAAKGKLSITSDIAKKIAPHLRVIEEGDFEGGFILQSDEVELDASFEGIINSLKPELESEVAKSLF